MTVSEELFEELCRANGVPCEPVPTREFRTPDFRVILKGVSVVFEIKQIDPNKEDEAELERLSEGKASGRYLPNRLRNKLDNISSQLKTASDEGSPTVLVIYDNTPFKSYSQHSDVLQALFGENSVVVTLRPNGTNHVSESFYGGKRRLTPCHNTSVSAVCILDGRPNDPNSLSLRVYANPYAAVPLPVNLLDVLPVTPLGLDGSA